MTFNITEHNNGGDTTINESSSSVNYTLSDACFAEGGQAKLYHVLKHNISSQLTGGKQLVCKVIRQDRISDPAGVALHSMAAAARLATRELRHPNLVRYVYTELKEHLVEHPNADDNSMCLELSLHIIMPQAQCDLSTWLRQDSKKRRFFGRGSRETKEVLLSIALQLVSALMHMHQQGVLHLDVSLGNILVSESSTKLHRNQEVSAAHIDIVLIDLETSTLGGQSPSPNFTVEFAAPERIKDAASCSPSCDVFSLGAVLFCLATRPEFPIFDIPAVGPGLLSSADITPTRLSTIIHRECARSNSLYIAPLLLLMLSHDPSTRISLRQAHMFIKQLVDGKPLQFPYVLPSLQLYCLDNSERKAVDIASDPNLYDMRASCVVCGKPRITGTLTHSDRKACVSSHMHVPGATSPSSPLPRALQPIIFPNKSDWNASTKHNFDVHGFEFHFLYPMAEATMAASAMEVASYSQNNKSEDDEYDILPAVKSPLSALQSNGGFAVFSVIPNDLLVCRTPDSVVSLAAPDDICGWQTDTSHRQLAALLAFSAAIPWESHLTQFLHRTGRIRNPVPACFFSSKTKASERQQRSYPYSEDDAASGIPLPQHFCWLIPNEEFVLASGETWIPPPHGGFVFWFNESPLNSSTMDRYFAVSTEQSTSLSKYCTTAPMELNVRKLPFVQEKCSAGNTVLKTTFNRRTLSPFVAVGAMLNSVTMTVKNEFNERLSGIPNTILSSAKQCQNNDTQSSPVPIALWVSKLNVNHFCFELIGCWRHQTPSSHQSTLRSRFLCTLTEEKGEMSAFRAVDGGFRALRPPRNSKYVCFGASSATRIESVSESTQHRFSSLLPHGAFFFFADDGTAVGVYAVTIFHEQSPQLRPSSLMSSNFYTNLSSTSENCTLPFENSYKVNALFHLSEDTDSLGVNNDAHSFQFALGDHLGPIDIGPESVTGIERVFRADSALWFPFDGSLHIKNMEGGSSVIADIYSP